MEIALMGGYSVLLLLFHPIFLQFAIAVALSSPLHRTCTNRGNFTSNSTYKSNLDHLLSSMASNSELQYGFYAGSIGQNADQVSAIALCRGDAPPDTCRRCINDASQVIIKVCPNNSEAIVGYDYCMLRYPNRSIFRKMEFASTFRLRNNHNVSDANKFAQVLNSLLNRLTSRAASSETHWKYAAGNVRWTSDQTIYAMVQCTPDLSEKQCTDCLVLATAVLTGYFNGKTGGQFVAPSCQFRYELYLFYGPAANNLLESPVDPQVLAPAVRPTLVPPLPTSGSSTTTALPIFANVLAFLFSLLANTALYI